MKTIRYEAADGIGWLILNRPDRMNAMTNANGARNLRVSP